MDTCLSLFGIRPSFSSLGLSSPGASYSVSLWLSFH